ncbi:MAG: hypothetical protein KME45_06100 [Stenomitos rutilans HA7619-LM2]|nr:hypothetical protein [Stenomitos rutilans HA7619-LM2]
MTVPASACCAVVLNQQQQAMQHHEHCVQAKSDQARADHIGGKNALKSRVTIASDRVVPKQCTVVERGRVVVKDMTPTDEVDPTDANNAAR